MLTSAKHTTQRFRPTRVASVAFASLSVLLSVGAGALMLASSVPFETGGDRTRGLVQALKLSPKHWVAVYFFAAQCGCSRKAAEYLVRQSSFPGLASQAVLIGDDERIRGLFQAANHPLALQETEFGTRFGLYGAPALLLIDPKGEIRYLGGYAVKTSGSITAYRDREIWNAVQNGGKVTSLPIFGCATSRSLRRRMDPLGLKSGWFALPGTDRTGEIATDGI